LGVYIGSIAIGSLNPGGKLEEDATDGCEELTVRLLLDAELCIV
jgi:hypothetical protein